MKTIHINRFEKIVVKKNKENVQNAVRQFWATIPDSNHSSSKVIKIFAILMSVF